MKTLKTYIIESTDKIKTQDVVNVLKDSGETSKEIKQDIDIKQKYINYKTLITAFTKKCDEWAKAFKDLRNNVAKEEGEDYLDRNLGELWVDEFFSKMLEFGESVFDLKTQLSEDVNEGISVSNVENYKKLYNLLTLLKNLDDLMVNWEKNHIKNNEFKKLVDARKKISDKIQELFKMSGKIKKLIDITSELMNRKFRR